MSATSGESYSPKRKPVDSQNDSQVTLADFWASFRFFSASFDDYCFNHWYLIPITYYLVILPFDIIYDIRASTFNFFLSSNSLTRFQLTDWILLLLIATLAFTVLAFNRWRLTIPTTFQILLTKGRIRSFHRDSDTSREYQQLLHDYQRALRSKRRYLVSAVSILIAWFLYFLVSSRYAPSTVIGAKNDPFFSFIRWFFWIVYPGIICGYFFGVAAWAIAVTGFYIKNLTKRFQLAIQPSHPDNCGGLKMLGDFCFGMVLPILIGATLLGVYGIGGIIYPDLTRRLTIIPIAANISLFVFVLPLAAIAFFVPLWNIHREMVRGKEEYEDEYAVRIEGLEKRIRVALDQKNLEEAKNARDEFEILQALHPNRIGYPSWPFDRRILFTFLTSQVIPLLSLIASILAQLPRH